MKMVRDHSGLKGKSKVNFVIQLTVLDWDNREQV